MSALSSGPDPVSPGFYLGVRVLGFYEVRGPASAGYEPRVGDKKCGGAFGRCGNKNAGDGKNSGVGRF